VHEGGKVRVRVGETDVWLAVTELGRGWCRVGIDAPADCPVHREALLPAAERYRASPRGDAR
jgi:sRNA-binding carbon storage regulator CsrA